MRLGHSHVGDAVDDVLARIAEPIVREIGSGHDDRIRICANDTCRWIFYDESMRNGMCTPWDPTYAMKAVMLGVICRWMFRFHCIT